MVETINPRAHQQRQMVFRRVSIVPTWRLAQELLLEEESSLFPHAFEPLGRALHAKLPKVVFLGTRKSALQGKFSK